MRYIFLYVLLLLSNVFHGMEIRLEQLPQEIFEQHMLLPEVTKIFSKKRSCKKNEAKVRDLYKLLIKPLRLTCKTLNKKCSTFPAIISRVASKSRLPKLVIAIAIHDYCWVENQPKNSNFINCCTQKIKYCHKKRIPIVLAAKNFDRKMVQLLESCTKDFIIFREEKLWRTKDKLLVDFLCDKADHIDTYTLLEWAIDYDRYTLFKYLLDQGVSVNGVFENGISPLFMACRDGRWEMIELLLQRGADVNKVWWDANNCAVTPFKIIVDTIVDRTSDNYLYIGIWCPILTYMIQKIDNTRHQRLQLTQMRYFIIKYLKEYGSQDELLHKVLYDLKKLIDEKYEAFEKEALEMITDKISTLL